MTTDTPGTIRFAHGSPYGYSLGCRSRAGCRWRSTDAYFSCAESRVARAGDIHLRTLPPNVPIPRDSARQLQVIAEAARIHGTSYGFARGCRSDEACPNYLSSDQTCVQARRSYHKTYLQERSGGQHKTIEHGTTRGYNSGCRDAKACPAETGLSCTAARRLERQRESSTFALQPRTLVEVSELGALIEHLVGTGMSERQIARRLGVGRTTVGCIRAAVARGDTPTVARATLRKLVSI